MSILSSYQMKKSSLYFGNHVNNRKLTSLFSVHNDNKPSSNLKPTFVCRVYTLSVSESKLF